MNRRLYVAALIAAAVALVLLRLFAIPIWDGTEADPVDLLAPVTDSLLGGALAALGVTVLMFWLYRAETREAKHSVVLPPRVISAELRSAADVAREWTFRGHTGRYVRCQILPILSSSADHHGRYVSVRAQLLDPDQEDQILALAAYRSAVNPNQSSYWTADQASAEIVATIAALVELSSRNPRVSCSIALGGLVTPFTVDMTPEVAIVTRESSNMPAMKYPAGSTFYDSTVEDLNLTRDQVRMLPKLGDGVVEIDSVDSLRALLAELGVGERLSDEVLATAVRSLRNPVNPYADG